MWTTNRPTSELGQTLWFLEVYAAGISDIQEGEKESGKEGNKELIANLRSLRQHRATAEADVGGPAGGRQENRGVSAALFKDIQETLSR